MAELLEPPKPQVRLLVCRKCQTIDEVPDYEGTPDGDDLLQRVVAKHQNSCGDAVEVGGETPEVATQKDRFLVKIDREQWNNDRVRKEVMSRLSMGYSGFEDTVYNVRNAWYEDAMSCFNKHRRPQDGCIDYKTKAKRVGNGFLDEDEKALRRDSGLFTNLKRRREQQTVFLCDFCPVKSGVQEKAFLKDGLYDK